MNTERVNNENNGVISTLPTTRHRIQAFASRGRYEVRFQLPDRRLVIATLRENRGRYTVIVAGREIEIRSTTNQLYARVGRRNRTIIWSRVDLRQRVLTTLGIRPINTINPRT